MEKKKRSGLFLTVAPLYIFTLVFVAGPLLYMIALSFATNSDGWGTLWKFTLENYKKIADPVYLKSFSQSFQLAFTSTICITLLGYPFGYFMAKQSAKWKKRNGGLIMVPFWTSSLIRMYGWIILLQAKGVFNTLLMKLGIIEEPLKILYSYPAVVIGMIYALLPFMGALRVFQRGKNGLVFGGGCKRSGGQPGQGIFDDYAEADAARTFDGCDPVLCAVHGTVFHCGYSGRK